MTVNILEKQLQKTFNIGSLRPGQREIIEDVMKGNDVLGILPTGSGKSLCYQLPAIILDGITIVVSPLISLMQDQVKQLKSTGFKAVAALNSFMEPREKKRILHNLDDYKLIYVSPELLQQGDMIDLLKSVKVSLFVIDEAHCISQWGHEFRPDYLRIHEVLKSLNNPPVLALSATATKEVQDDIIHAINRPGTLKHIYPVDRENIIFSIQKVNADSDKRDILINLLKNYRVPTLIYFSSRQKTEEIAAFLSKNVPSHRVAFYHGGMDQLDRVTIQQQFMNDQLDVICCTSAFGMGINKHNIRMVLHYHFPLQIESFIQEVGRAGRDGLSSISLLLYAQNDEQIPISIIENELPSEEMLHRVFNTLYQMDRQSSVLPPGHQLEQELGLSETQWRFLHYQMEKHGIINDNRLHYQKDHWHKTVDAIEKLIIDRKSLKEWKLNEMIHWIHQEECLRKHIYKGFQDGVKPPLYSCCSNCGFAFSEWKPAQTETYHHHYTWKNKLRNLLLVGDSDDKTK